MSFLKRFLSNETTRREQSTAALTCEQFEDRCMLNAVVGEVIEFNGHAYALTTTSGNWDYVRNEAEMLGGHLVNIESQAEQDFLEENFAGYYYIGATDRGVEGSFNWLGGAGPANPFEYSNWAPGEPNDWQGNEDFAMFTPNGQWNDVPLNAGIQGIIELENPSDRNASFAQDGTTYFLSRAVTYEGAKAEAEALGGNLVSINSQQEQNLVDRNFNVSPDFGSRGPNEYYIGYNDVNSEGNFTWDDESGSIFTSWSPGEPNNWQEEDYVIVGQNGWNDVDGDLPLRGVIEIKPSTGQPTGETFISSDYVLTSAGTWDEVRAQALSLGGELVSINSAEEQAYLQSQYGDGYYYIGLSDQYREGAFRWDNREELTYSNFAPGEPNDWQGEDFVIMTPGGQWNDVGGETVLQAIVEIDPLRGKLFTNGFGLYTLTTAGSYDQVKADAAAMNGQLVTPGNSNFNQNLVDMFGSLNQQLYLEATDTAVEGVFRSGSGTALNYLNWANGEPNNSTNSGNTINAQFGQDHIAMNPDGTWDDVWGYTTPLRGIVQLNSVNTGGFSGAPTTPYIVTPKAYTIDEARALASELGFAIPDITSQTLNDRFYNGFLGDNQIRDEAFWIGLTDEVTEGDFLTYRGTEPFFVNFQPGEPNDYGTGEDFVTMMAINYDGTTVNGTWNDVSGDQRFKVLLRPITG